VVDSTDGNYSTVKYDWSKADLCTYKKAVQNNLANVNIPQFLLGCNFLCNRADHLSAIDEYYASIIACIKQCTDACVPTVNSYVTKHNVPGWTDLVKDKHAAARAAYLDWISEDKARSGYVHQAMLNTTAAFKLALRHCKAAEEQLKADGRAKQLDNKQNPRAFWNSIRRDSCKRVSPYVNKIGNAVGASDITIQYVANTIQSVV